ncbi:MAG: ribonuclease P protein component [bacterium]|nr:ribonuclease P protein component [bacterium]
MLHFYLRVEPANTARVIISVSKKISKSAVTRNTIRRRVRPLVAKFISDLNPATYFIVAKPGAEKIKGEELETELRLLVVGRWL